MSPVQRAQILVSTIFRRQSCDDVDNKKIFTEAGGWKYLLPKSIQKIVDESNNENVLDNEQRQQWRQPDSIQFDKTIEDNDMEELYYDIGHASTEDEDESKDDDQIDTADNSINEASNKATENRRTKPISPSVTKNNKSTTSPSSTKQPKESSKDTDVSRLFFKIVVDMFNDKFHSACQRLERHHSAMVLTAFTTFTILVLQFRNSTTARHILKSVAHIVVTTTSSVAFTGSLLALLTPYLHQRLVEQKQHQLRASNRRRTDYDIIQHWSTTLLSFLQTNFGMISKIPKTSPLPTPIIIQKNIQQFLARWKGTLAVFLLTYFQYRYRKLVQVQRRRCST